MLTASMSTKSRAAVRTTPSSVAVGKHSHTAFALITKGDEELGTTLQEKHKVGQAEVHHPEVGLLLFLNSIGIGWKKRESAAKKIKGGAWVDRRLPAPSVCRAILTEASAFSQSIPLRRPLRRGKDSPSRYHQAGTSQRGRLEALAGYQQVCTTRV